MSHGCPVVCSSAGAIPEVVGDAGVYFDPNNPEELRITLERVVDDRVGWRRSLRARGHMHGLPCFPGTSVRPRRHRSIDKSYDAVISDRVMPTAEA